MWPRSHERGHVVCSTTRVDVDRTVVYPSWQNTIDAAAAQTETYRGVDYPCGSQNYPRSDCQFASSTRINSSRQSDGAAFVCVDTVKWAGILVHIQRTRNIQC